MWRTTSYVSGFSDVNLVSERTFGYIPVEIRCAKAKISYCRQLNATYIGRWATWSSDRVWDGKAIVGRQTCDILQ
jgi:hypothetical protein